MYVFFGDMSIFNWIICGVFCFLFSLLKFVKNLFCNLTCDLSWRMLLVRMRRTYILLLLGEMVCICLLGHLVYKVQLFCFPIDLLSGCFVYYRKRGIDIPYSYCVAFSSINVCFTYLGALVLHAYMFITIISSC